MVQSYPKVGSSPVPKAYHRSNLWLDGADESTSSMDHHSILG